MLFSCSHGTYTPLGSRPRRIPSPGLRIEFSDLLAVAPDGALFLVLFRNVTLPYLTLPYLSLPYLTLPYLTLPYLTLPLDSYTSGTRRRVYETRGGLVHSCSPSADIRNKGWWRTSHQPVGGYTKQGLDSHTPAARRQPYLNLTLPYLTLPYFTFPYHTLPYHPYLTFPGYSKEGEPKKKRKKKGKPDF